VFRGSFEPWDSADFVVWIDYQLAFEVGDDLSGWIHGSGLTDEITNTLGVYGLDGVKDVISSGFGMYSSLYITLITSSGLPFSYSF